MYPMKQTVITSLPQAFRVIKEMNLASEEWDCDYRAAGREAVRRLLQQRMNERISCHLEEMACRAKDVTASSSREPWGRCAPRAN